MDKILRHLNHAGLTPPKVLTLVMTNRCNLNCRHCWPDSRGGDDAPIVKTDVLLRLIREFAGIGTKSIMLTGGEPLTHPNWFEILSFACNQKGIKDVCLQTNAILIRNVDVEKLVSLKERGLSLQVSLEGSGAENHDHVRGRGSFEQTLEGLRHLTEAGLGSQICVASTEMEHNFDDIPHLLDFVCRMGIGRFVTYTLVRSGRAAQSDGLAHPTPSQYKWLIDRYHGDDTFRTQYQKLGNIAALEWHSGQSTPWTPCCSFIEKPYVTAEGIMYPCVMLHADAFAGKGLHEKSLETVILETLPRWIELQKTNRSRIELKACEECKGKSHCAAGCMGRAYAAYGKLLSVEDRCTLRQAVYAWPGEKIVEN